MARGIVKFSATPVPEDPRSSYNFGVIEGGTSINSIPARAAVKVDLRSEDENELGRLESALRDAMQSGAKDEMSAWQASGDALKLDIRSLGVRPAGKLPADSPLVATVRSVDRLFGESIATREQLDRCERAAVAGNSGDCYRKRRPRRGHAYARRVVRSRRPRAGIEAAVPHHRRAGRPGVIVAFFEFYRLRR